MAIINGSVIGNLSGKLGNLTARTIEGKTILASRPSSFTPSMDPIVVSNRSKFGITSNFVKFILTLGSLNDVWKLVKKNGMSVFNTALQYNFPYTSAKMPTVENVITPSGFDPPVTSLAVDSIDITASLSPLNEASVITASEVNLNVLVLVCFHNPISSDYQYYQIIPVSKSIESFNFNSTYNLNISLNHYQKNIQNKYRKYIIYFALVIKDAAGNVVRYSSTFAKQSA